MRILHVKKEKIQYTDISKIDPGYTDKMDREYDWMAPGYDLFMILFPMWKSWIKKVIPHISGKKVLEVSFGNGYLITKYGVCNDYEISGIDYNQKMVAITTKKIAAKRISADLLQANVENLPFEDNTFDTIINTMAFTGYPDGDKALAEMKRVLKNKGKLLIVDFDYPANGNIFGFMLVKLMEKSGDIIKNIGLMLKKHGFNYQDYPVGGFGSVHLFIGVNLKE